MPEKETFATFEEPMRKWCALRCSFYYTEMAEYVEHVKAKHPAEAWFLENATAVPM